MVLLCCHDPRHAPPHHSVTCPVDMRSASAKRRASEWPRTKEAPLSSNPTVILSKSSAGSSFLSCLFWTHFGTALLKDTTVEAQGYSVDLYVFKYAI